MHLLQSEGLVQFGVNLPGLQCQSGEISTLNSVLLPRSSQFHEALVRIPMEKYCNPCFTVTGEQEDQRTEGVVG